MNSAGSSASSVVRSGTPNSLTLPPVTTATFERSSTMPVTSDDNSTAQLGFSSEMTWSQSGMTSLMTSLTDLIVPSASSTASATVTSFGGLPTGGWASGTLSSEASSSKATSFEAPTNITRAEPTFSQSFTSSVTGTTFTSISVLSSSISEGSSLHMEPSSSPDPTSFEATTTTRVEIQSSITATSPEMQSSQGPSTARSSESIFPSEKSSLTTSSTGESTASPSTGSESKAGTRTSMSSLTTEVGTTKRSSSSSHDESATGSSTTQEITSPSVSNFATTTSLSSSEKTTTSDLMIDTSTTGSSARSTAKITSTSSSPSSSSSMAKETTSMILSSSSSSVALQSTSSSVSSTSSRTHSATPTPICTQGVEYAVYHFASSSSECAELRRSYSTGDPESLNLATMIEGKVPQGTGISQIMKWSDYGQADRSKPFQIYG